MQYMGSKNRIAKHILPAMLEQRGDRVWVEPFVGGANMIDKVTGSRIGNDSHRYLIALLRSLQNGWVPPCNVSKELYYDIKANKDDHMDDMVGFTGFLCSFGGKWWGGYAANKKGDNYAARGSRVLVKQAENFRGISFTCMDYREMNIPENSLIYCDPPYESTTSYSGSFNHVVFWQWCRQMTLNGHLVFISEYHAPDDFKCIQSVQHKTILDKNSNCPREEKLFRFNA